MIRVSNGDFKCLGDPAELLVEYAHITFSLKKGLQGYLGKEKTKEMMEEMFQFGMKQSKEIPKNEFVTGEVTEQELQLLKEYFKRGGK